MNGQGFISQLFEWASEALTGTAGLLTSGANSLVSVFWTAPTGEQEGSLTILGLGLALGLGAGAIYFLFRMVKNWISRAKG